MVNIAFLKILCQHNYYYYAVIENTVFQQGIIDVAKVITYEDKFWFFQQIHQISQSLQIELFFLCCLLQTNTQIMYCIYFLATQFNANRTSC